MYSETHEMLNRGTLQCGSDGSEVVTWSESGEWDKAADYNVCIVHLRVHHVSTASNLTITVYAEDASGRIFVPIALSSNTITTTGALRVVVSDFAALLKIGVGIQHTSSEQTAVVTAEYTLKQS